MLDIFTLRSTQDFSFLYKFYKYFVPSKYDSITKKRIFSEFLDMLFDKNKTQMSNQTKVNASKFLVCPMLIKSFKNGQVLIYF